LTARELRLVLTLLLVMFMTGDAWRYVGALTGPRLLILISGPVLAAFALIGVGLGRQLRPAKRFVSLAPPRAGQPPPWPRHASRIVAWWPAPEYGCGWRPRW
jgi:hypothetical protein